MKITRYTFRLADPSVSQVSLGSSPRIVVGADGFTTADERLARRLAAHPELVCDTEEINAPDADDETEAEEHVDPADEEDDEQ